MTEVAIIERGPTAESLTMSSREIADLVNSRHDNVKTTIERLAERGVITLPALQEVPNPGPGPRALAEYRIGKRDSYVIVAQLSPEFTARLVDRWQELESGAAIAVPAIPPNYAAALRLAADMAEQKERAEAALAIAAPKLAALDRIAIAGGSLCVTDAAKSLQIRPVDLFHWLSSNQWAYRRPGASHWIGYQSKLQQGLLEHKVTTVRRNDGSDKVTEQVRITPKGLAKIAESLACLEAA